MRPARATESKRTEHWRLGPGPHLGAELRAWLGQPAPQGPVGGHSLSTRSTRNTAQGGQSLGRARQSRAKRIKDRAESPPGAQPFTPAVGAGRVRVGRGQSPRGRGTGAGSSEGERAGAPAHRSAKGCPRPPGGLHSQHRMSTQSLSVRSSQSPGCRKTWHPVYRWPAGFCLFPPTAFYRRQHKSLSQLP